MIFEDLNTDDQTMLAAIRADLVRHESLLADARRSGLPAQEIHEIEALISGDHTLIAAMERKIARDEQAATDPELLELRRHVDSLSFEECVVALLRRENAGPLSVPSNTPENLQHLRSLVFEDARDGRITLPRRRKPVARRLPIVTIDGTRYYRDDRLREYRAVDNPHDRLPLVETHAPAATTVDSDHRNGTVDRPTASPMADETITNGVGDAWICVCGNDPRSDGFYACDTDGNEVEPVRGWSGLYVCAACGRIIDPDTLRVVGRNPEPRMLP